MRASSTAPLHVCDGLRDRVNAPRLLTAATLTWSTSACTVDTDAVAAVETCSTFSLHAGAHPTTVNLW
jgi:hypothetical protein